MIKTINDSFSFDRLSVAVLAAAEDVEVLASIFSLWQLEGLIREGRGEFSYIYKFCDVLFQVFCLETQMSNSNKMYLNFSWSCGALNLHVRWFTCSEAGAKLCCTRMFFYFSLTSYFTEY